MADQLRAVAQTIVAHGALGPNRQVFFVQIGSFDTHDGQNDRQSLLLAQVDHALNYFDTEMTARGYGAAVTTFTASDFTTLVSPTMLIVRTIFSPKKLRISKVLPPVRGRELGSRARIREGASARVGRG